jgi:hypothetical protein
MAGGKFYTLGREFGFGQLMLISAMLCAADQPNSHAQTALPAKSGAAKSGTAKSGTANSDPATRALLLYLGEFAPELDPIEVSEIAQTDDKLAEPQANVDASNQPEN